MQNQQQKNQRQILREQFELVAPNIKSILIKKSEAINFHERQLLVSTLKKVIFIKSSFDLQSSNFVKLALCMQLQMHRKGQTVFEKGEPGQYFYIVLQGVYCVEVDNAKQGKKEKQIYYYPGDSFGEVSLIYDTPRGASIVSDQNSCLLKIKKQVFNSCGNLRQKILYLNTFFESHPFFQKQNSYRLRIMSSLSKLVKFKQNETIINENEPFNQIFFFIKGQAKIFKSLQLEHNGIFFEQMIELDQLGAGSVFGKQLSNVKIVGTNRGQYVKVSFKEDIRSVDTPLSKRIRQNAMRYPCDEEILAQYKIYCQQRLKQLQFLSQLYQKDNRKDQQLLEARKKYLKVKDANLTHRKLLF